MLAAFELYFQWCDLNCNTAMSQRRKQQWSEEHLFTVVVLEMMHMVMCDRYWIGIQDPVANQDGQTQQAWCCSLGLVVWAKTISSAQGWWQSSWSALITTWLRDILKISMRTYTFWKHQQLFCALYLICSLLPVLHERCSFVV